MLATDIRRFSYIPHIIAAIFRPQIEFARRHVMERLLPTFDNIESEADQVAGDEYRNAPFDENDDGGGAGELAIEAGHAYYYDAFGFKQGFINLLFVHLHHLFEQQLAYLVRYEQPNRVFDYAKSADLYQGVHKTFGFDITFFEAWEPVEELRWIANTVKHAEAKDAAKLKVQRPDLFNDPRMPADIKQEWQELTKKWPKPVQLPLVGEFFFPPPADYVEKVEAVLAFWEEFAAVLRGDKPKPKSLRDFVFENREQIIEIVAKYGASNVRVFGSVARGEAGPASDVDLLIHPGEQLGLFKLVGLERELSELLGRKVDLGTDGGIKPRLKDRVLAEAVPL